MIPILYNSTETEFDSNGLGRLRDCIECKVTEERNGIYEVEFSYPVDGANYDKIQLGRIIAVEHDYTNDVQPFDIVSCSKPINGVVTFRAVHISYRQGSIVARGSSISSLSDAFTMLRSGVPSNPFTYETDITSTAYMASADGLPHTVRSMLGGTEGSILDTYGGEYEWDKFRVILHASRGRARNLTIRYGVNLVDYTEETDYSESYNAVVPFWSGEDTAVIGDMISVNTATYNGRTDCVPLDLTDKFESQPTKAQVESMATSLLNSKQPYLAHQNITVNFIRLQDTAEYAQYASLFDCALCDTVRVVFPRYGMDGRFKIVKTVYNVLTERWDEIELGQLQTTLAEALGINTGDTTSNTITALSGMIQGADPTKRHSISVTADTVFTASYTGWLSCAATTNSGQTIAPYMSIDAYTSANEFDYTLSASWGITTATATLVVGAPVKKGCKYRIHPVRCTITGASIFEGGTT